MLAGASRALVLCAELRDQLPRLRIAQRRRRLRLAKRPAQLADTHHLLLAGDRLISAFGSRSTLRSRGGNGRRRCSWRGDRADAGSWRWRAATLNRAINDTLTFIHLRSEGCAITEGKQCASQRLRAGLFRIVAKVPGRL